MALETSPENPAPVRTVSALLSEYIGRLGPIWVEGQIAQLNRRPGSNLAFFVLRDAQANMSLSVACAPSVLDSSSVTIAEGQQVVIHARVEFWAARGSLQLRAREIRPVGLGELLARLEALRELLSAEGLFGLDRKRALPFLPNTVGLICGRASDAEHDVIENAQLRWPNVRFAVRNVAVQGAGAVTQVTSALRELDEDPSVDVIVITRGGGSTEDLLPFSNEALIRAVAQVTTPVVSAIGHEKDTPLLDFVADVRASTPTDAARRIVPDMAEEMRLRTELSNRLQRALITTVEREERTISTLRARPAFAHPQLLLDRAGSDIRSGRDRGRQAWSQRLTRAADSLMHEQARVRALSPAATLERGYAIVTRTDGAIVRQSTEVRLDERLRVRLVDDSIDVVRVESESPVG
jgi:exodeoxyribonuclease VII large subunit